MAKAGSKFGHIDSASGECCSAGGVYSVSAAKQIVAASNGIGTATFSMLERELRDGLLAPVALTIPGLETGYSIITLRGHPDAGRTAFVESSPCCR